VVVLTTCGEFGLAPFSHQDFPQFYSMGFLEEKKPCQCGVQHGDPLSPILFVEGADLIQTTVNHLAQKWHSFSSSPNPQHGLYLLCNMHTIQ
jgi:hypothetical protein